MGTPDFAVPFLEALYARHPLALVVTQPDRPKGRGRALAAPAVKVRALELGLPVVEPESLKTPEFHALVREQAADLLVVVAFRILPASLFPLARLGAVNVHGSLLPKYRGAAPIQWAIAAGEAETGVTVFQLDAQVDHGGILAREATPIGPEETAGDLFLRLREMGTGLLLRVLDDLEAGRASPLEQDHGLSTPAPKLKKEDGRLDWTRPAQKLHDLIRAFSPYPTCYTTQAGTGRVLRIHASRVEADPDPPGAPGEVRISQDRHPLVVTGQGLLKLVEVQWEGKPRVGGSEFVNGLQPPERTALRFQ